jgi:hypothetical protein
LQATKEGIIFEGGNKEVGVDGRAVWCWTGFRAGNTVCWRRGVKQAPGRIFIVEDEEDGEGREEGRVVDNKIEIRLRGTLRGTREEGLESEIRINIRRGREEVESVGGGVT